MTAIDVPPCGCPAGRQPGEHPDLELHRQVVLLFSRPAIFQRVVVKHTGASHYPTDADTELARQIHHRGYRKIVERQYGPRDEARQDDFFDDDWDPALYEIVCCDDVLCGRISVVDRADAIIVRDIVILPECQNRGIGTILLQEEIARARLRGVHVQLGTHCLNCAPKFYLRLGFRVIGQTETPILLEAR